MSTRVTYRDALGIDRLVAVTEFDSDALALVRRLAAEVPRAGGRLFTVAGPLLDFSMQVAQPPYFLDNAPGMPVVYLGGAVDTVTNWQAHAVAALRSTFFIANPRRERPCRTPGDIAADAKWRHRHLMLSDVAVFWFEPDDRDQMPLLEMGICFVDTTMLAIGTAPQWPRRAELAGLLRDHEPGKMLHENLDATLAYAVDLVESRDTHGLPRIPSAPEAAEGILYIVITRQVSDRTTGEWISDILAAAAHAAIRSKEPALLTRLQVAVDDLRLDDTDPLAWTELHAIADALRQRY
jgi:hypothetical protein